MRALERDDTEEEGLAAAIVAREARADARESISSLLRQVEKNKSERSLLFGQRVLDDGRREQEAFSSRPSRSHRREKAFSLRFLFSEWGFCPDALGGV